jgi:ABC-type transport system involved in multi-copper enzyme maturation permease subunit
MNNFGSLVAFEYKKIFIRKSVWIALLLALAATVLSVFSLVIGSDPDTGISYYEDEQKDKAYSLALSGRPLDGKLILETSKAYQNIPNNVYPYSESVEYQTYARPYSSVYTLIDSAYAERGRGFDISDLQKISEEDANRFYERRINQYRINLENNPSFSKENVDRIIEADSQVQKPFIMEYTDGYERFFSFSTTNAFIVMFLIAFILSPMFVNEYGQRTDSLILTTKNGKISQIYAKIFTGISFSMALSTFSLLIGYILCMCVYGFEGANAPIQLHMPLLTYHFTMLEVVMILFVTTILGGFFMTGICFFLSSAMNHSIVVLIMSVTVVLLGMFNGIFPSFIEKIRYFFPSPMGTYFDVILNQYSWNIFGIELWLYQAVCVVAAIVGSLLLILTYRNFEQHQIG